MMNIFRLFKNRNVPAGKIPDAGTEPGTAEQQSGIQQRLADMYGRDMLEMQAMYEKQVVRDTWLLKDEAIWLIAGIDPAQHNQADEEARRKLAGLWDHARKCVEEGLLDVANREQEPDQWEVRPVDIYQWARISRVELPDIFSNLMGFIVQSVKSSRPATPEDTGGADYDRKAQEFDRDRETVLGMAVAVLAAWPERCKSSSGRIKADRIVAIINDREKHWLGGRQTAMSATAKRDLIGKWLATVPE